METLTDRTLHVAVDMQRLFAEPTVWHVPGLGDILPGVTAIARAQPGRTVFARFLTPPAPDAAQGRWRTYYRRWDSLTADRLAPGMLDLVAPLASLAAPGTLVDKTTYSIFEQAAFTARLQRDRVDTIVLTGVETDICVLASLFDAVDRGYRVVVPVDAVTSSATEAHRAVLDHLLPRMPEQVDLTTVAALLEAWTTRGE